MPWSPIDPTGAAARLRVLFGPIVLAHDRRRVVYFNVTEHPTSEWTAQQLVEALPWEPAPEYLLRDRDAVYGARTDPWEMEAPDGRAVQSPELGEVIEFPAVHGLHHYDLRQAA